VSGEKNIRVSVIQGRAVYLDLERTLTKTAALTEAAARNGSRLVCFGETWLPGYPAWLDHCPDAGRWDHPPVKQVFEQLRDNSITVDGREAARLGQLAADCKIAIVIGINERVDSGPGHGTLYNTLLTFGPEGRLLNHHRKLVPTYTERMVWGEGDGRGLAAAAIGGVRVGGLVCWEHWMPLARQALHTSGEHLHVAAWPTVHEMHQVASRHYAFEGRCFVLAVGLIMTAGDLPSLLPRPEHLADDNALVLRGGSAIFGPTGQYVCGPVFDQEATLTADLDLGEIDREQMTLDVSGHYFRPDIFELKVHDRSQE
jgi:predicted amidohydrolase